MISLDEVSRILSEGLDNSITEFDWGPIVQGDVYWTVNFLISPETLYGFNFDYIEDFLKAKSMLYKNEVKSGPNRIIRLHHSQGVFKRTGEPYSEAPINKTVDIIHPSQYFLQSDIDAVNASQWRLRLSTYKSGYATASYFLPDGRINVCAIQMGNLKA